ncbi:MAG: hypothetical protein O6837_00550 [Deltaproteobacteria bacterium]|nr:hypothetical protein [Deltaproteobacteria bacterium]
MLNSWLHHLALAVYLGSLGGLWVLILSSLPMIRNQSEQIEFLARILKVYNPLLIGALGFLVLTGAFQVTDLKASYRELFTKELGATLSLKLILSFVIIILSTYQTMGVALRFVRRWESKDSIQFKEFQSIAHRLRGSTIILVFLTLITAVVGIRILR